MAISTALGNKLNQILVRDIDAAESCVGFLRRHQLGRADFICADQQVQRYEQLLRNGLPDAPAQTKRLMDVILVGRQHSREVNCAFCHIARDTVVCQDIKVASRIAFASDKAVTHQIVTLDGKTIEKTGVMSGGGRPRQGLIRVQGQPKPIDAAEMAGQKERQAEIDREIRLNVQVEEDLKRQLNVAADHLKRIEASRNIYHQAAKNLREHE